MYSTLRRAITPTLTILIVALVLSGCQPVRQNKTITFSKDGSTVGFQHGPDGVYVAGKEGGPPVKVFEPDPNVAAMSTPLWNPKDGRLLFAMARRKDGKNPPRLFSGETPAGSVHGQHAIIYTCWLRNEPKDEGPSKPIPLFHGACDHIGYVAANLAIRWHPAGDRILYINQTDDGRHSLYEYDLATGTSRRAFPETAPALIFNWAPDGSRLACVLSGTDQGRQDGIWIGNPDENDWWHIQESRHLAKGELESSLERLQATQPAWTNDGTFFAFVSTRPKLDKKQPDQHVLWLGLPTERRIDVAAEGAEPFRDLHWAPDGKHLGLVRGGELGSLQIIERNGKQLKPVNSRPVRRFAGWSAGGEWLAYTLPDKLPYAGGEQWAFLLLPDPLARDAVHVAPSSGDEPGHEVFSGMRITFPSWSPREDKLSLWFTFSPVHRFLLYRFLGGGLYPGDPAAVFDVKDGSIGWMAVNNYEKGQVGHYYLLKRDYAAAWARYQEAGPEPTKRPPSEDFLRNLQAPRDFTFFEYHCLKKLGKGEDARARLDLFRRTFLPEPQKDGQVAGTNRVPTWLIGQDEIWAALLKDFYAAEVFLSLDAAPDAQQFFEESLKSASTDADRLSTSMALGQVLLLEKKHADYAELTTATIAPLLMKVWKPGPLDLHSQGPALDQRWLFLQHAALALAPIYSPQFLGKFPKEKLQALVPRWTALREKAPDDVTKLGADLFLHAAYKVLGLEKERQEVARRIDTNPASSELLPKEGYEDLATSVRQPLVDGIKQFDALRDFFSSLE